MALLGRGSLNNLPRAGAVMNKRRFITYKCGLIYACSKLSGQRYTNVIHAGEIYVSENGNTAATCNGPMGEPRE